MKKFVYADNAATTPLSETAFEAMKPWLTEYYGNPSSLYRIGRAAKEALNEARATVGKCLNAAMPVNEANDYAPGEIIFKMCIRDSSWIARAIKAAMLSPWRSACA